MVADSSYAEGILLRSHVKVITFPQYMSIVSYQTWPERNLWQCLLFMNADK